MAHDTPERSRGSAVIAGERGRRAQGASVEPGAGDGGHAALEIATNIGESEAPRLTGGAITGYAHRHDLEAEKREVIA